MLCSPQANADLNHRITELEEDYKACRNLLEEEQRRGGDVIARMARESSSLQDVITRLEDELEQTKAKIPLAEMAAEYKKEVNGFHNCNTINNLINSG